MSEALDKKPDRWFIKKQGKVTGPFPVKLIGSYLILGRIDLDTLVSIDKTKWIPIGRLPSLIPAEFKNKATAEGKVDLQRAKLREDERRGESRRDGPNRRNSERSDADRRQPDDRRQNNEEVSASHIKLIADFAARRNIARHTKIIGAVVVLILVIGLAGSFFLIDPVTSIQKTDCTVKPAAGIDWRSCNKNNIDLVAKNLSKSNLHSVRLNGALLVKAQLSEANLSYASLEAANLSQANLSKALLVGANLNNTNLTNANLVGADFSYADLSNAVLLNVTTLNTKFDHVIWIDGRRCARGSIDQCIFDSPK